MSSRPASIDPQAFAVRRKIRDVLQVLLSPADTPSANFQNHLDILTRQRRIALKQMLLLYREDRIVDELAGLEVLGRIANADDAEMLAALVDDLSTPTTLRIACTLVLLGYDRADLVRAPDISGLVLRWQARYVGQEPSFRAPLMRLYCCAPPEERARWLHLQDEEVEDPESRAAVFEMLLEVEVEPNLRMTMLEYLAKVSHPTSRASLRRVRPTSSEEKDQITAALAALAAAADPFLVPDGWAARVGYCDGNGSFPLRFDYIPSEDNLRPRSAIFVLNLLSGTREALPLIGSEVARYDNLLPVVEGETLQADSPPMMYLIPVTQALHLLDESRRTDQRLRRSPPRDYRRALKLLDPLADLRPSAPSRPKEHGTSKSTAGSQKLQEHPAYASWVYGSSERRLDAFRRRVLDNASTASFPAEHLVEEVLDELAEGQEAQRLSAMLLHNAIVHRAAGESELARIAGASATLIRLGGLRGVGLVRHMVLEGLHPGHYFLTPPPEALGREVLVGLMVESERPTRATVLSVDLAWIMLRATEVWLSRIPHVQRPHSDKIQEMVLTMADRAAKTVVRVYRAAQRSVSYDHIIDRIPDRLMLVFRRTLTSLRFPGIDDDPCHDQLVRSLVRAVHWMLESICMNRCPHQCPINPRKSGRSALQDDAFPTNDEVVDAIARWPGPYYVEPTPEQAQKLDLLLAAACDGAEPSSSRGREPGPCDRGADKAYRCGVCRETRPKSTRSRTRIQARGGGEMPVCRRCQGRIRRNPWFRESVLRSLGEIRD